MRSHEYIDINHFVTLDKTRVRLVHTRDNRLRNEQEGYYVTLSHRWGSRPEKLTQLRKSNIRDFQQAILVDSLPQTFQDAINFARRLSPDIRYLWIDSLCILQDDEDDWNKESAQMHEVYRKSYCNLSATAAASDSDQGIHAARAKDIMWEDEINLNIDGLRDTHFGLLSMIKAQHGFNEYPNFRAESRIRRCKVRDLSFWSKNIEDAPLNQRAWVLQERLLAPRILHFCKDQIAWECCELEAAESFPYGVWGFELDLEKRLKQKHRLKAHMPEADEVPKALGAVGTGTFEAHEFWKGIVERYSITQLTKHKDRLVALAGIAQSLKCRIGGGYVAGLWEKYLASQLLWHVPSVFENDLATYPSKRPTYEPGDIRAPTFSWASVYASGGVKCAKAICRQELRIRVESLHGIPERNSERFGLIDDGCFIEISGGMKKIEIEQELRTLRTPNVYYVWKLVDESGRRRILCDLDCPDDDFDSISGPDREVYCVPVHKDPTRGLQCLLLKEEGEFDNRYYRRVGYSLIPSDVNWHNATLDVLWPRSDTLPRKKIRIV